ncbi:MAG: ABC transporter ATP-binding protein [Coriobacteriia bacterium]|nr:ABC transporter ATP-binding protein [Coriobacteriia bacterium]
MKYVRITRRIFGMLSVRLREGAVMVALLGLYASLEGFGIGLLLPVLQFLESGGEALPAGGVWPYLRGASEAVGVPINLATLLALAFVPILARQIVYYLNTWYNAILQNRAVERLTTRAFGAVAHAELAFIEAQDQGRLIGFMTGQIGRCSQALIQYIKLLGAVAIIAVYVLILAVISWPLTVIAIFSMVAVSMAMRRILTLSRGYGTEVSKATNAAYSAIRERLAALRLVKMRGREDAETEHVRRLAAILRKAGTRIAMAGAAVEVIVDPVLMLAVFVIIYLGVTGFGMTLAGLGLFMFILLRLNTKAKEVNVGRQALASLMPSFDYVEGMLSEAESARTVAGGTREFTGLREGIEFENVWFTYRLGGTEVLRGLSLYIPKGSLTAIVGRSGAGKSTLVDMIPLLRRPISGVIRFDGVPAEEFELPSLRRKIGFLTQEAILFNDTIWQNLVYGLDGRVADESVRKALDDSYCTEFVKDLPDGLETRIGDRGVRFSGGQRQRLALARVLLQDPDILILDEPTSALDSESERYIQAAFERIAEEFTVIVIAHRLSTVQRADQIVVLGEGRIVERGTHAQLLSDNGHYRRLFEQQIH